MAGPAASIDLPVPARAEGVELLGCVIGSGYRQPPSLVRRRDGQTLQLTPLLYGALDLIDGERSYADIADELTARIDRFVTAEDVLYLVERKLRPLGVLRGVDGSEPEVQRANPLLALRFRYVVSDPKVTSLLTTPFAQLFRPVVAVSVTVAFLLVSGWVLFEKGLASATYQAFHEPSMILLVFGLTLLSAGFHEFGHAAACRYGGVTPGAMGVGLYLVWPAFYTEVTDSYCLGRGGRLRVDLGGLYFNAIVAVATFLVWAATRQDAVLLIIAAQLLQMLRQLIPLVRFDGYHILADLIGVPDLFAHIKPTLLGLLPTRWRRPESTVLEPWARVVVTIWVLVVVPTLLLVFAMLVTALPRIAATAWESIQIQWDVLQVNWTKGDVANVGVRLLSFLALSIPVLSITYLVIRVVRRTVRRVWRATTGRPALRAAAGAAGLALIAALASAWWPTGQYEPVHPTDRGSILDFDFDRLAPAVSIPDPGLGLHTIVAEGLTALAPPAQHAPQQVRVILVATPADAAGAAATSLPPDLGPALAEAVDQSPPTEQPSPATEEPSPRPEWPFLFDRPLEPREGDNQALAINTEDGSTVREMSYSLVFLTDGPADHRNEAYAIASCRDCETLAVGFQVLLIVGQVDVVIPENIAVAVNYACENCVTSAMAVQLVATLTDMPDDSVMEQIAAEWSRLDALDTQPGPLALDRLYPQLKEIEASILTILAEGDVSSVTAEGTAEEAATGGALAGDAVHDDATPTTTATSSPSSTAGIPDGDASSPTATESPEGTEPTAEDSETSTASDDDQTATEDETEPSPTEEPSPSPTASDEETSTEAASEEPSPTGDEGSTSESEGAGEPTDGS